jgi:hypothetical protein
MEKLEDEASSANNQQLLTRINVAMIAHSSAVDKKYWR